MTAVDRRRFLRRSVELAAGFAAVGTLAGRIDAGAAAVGDASATGVDAFLAGYPLVTTVRTMQTFAGLFGVNRLFVSAALASPRLRVIVAPNHDTLYSLAVLDLRAGPMTLTLPDLPNRYHVFQLIDAWMDNFALLGTRTTGGRGGSWVIAPPGSTVAVPDGYRRIDAPTNQVMILGRIRAVDDADAKVAAALGRRVRLAPLAGAPASAAPVMPRPLGTPQSVGSNGVAYFDELGDALVANPPTAHAPRAAITRASKLGVGAGRHPTVEQSASTIAKLRAAVRAGDDELMHPTRAGGQRFNGWDVNLHVGEKKDAGLVRRATIAHYYWGPVPVAEAVYPRATIGSDGKPLDGAKRYRIHFAKGEMPPVDGFWSITAYGPDMFFVANSANRYSISGDTPGLVTNADGSLDLSLQHDAPAGHAANWLPVPAGPFNLIMRLYLPRAPIRNGSYRYPRVAVVT